MRCPHDLRLAGPGRASTSEPIYTMAPPTRLPRMGACVLVALATLTVAPTILPAEAASLRGSRAAMIQQNHVAKDHGLTFFRTAADIHAAVESGELVELTGNADYEVASFVSHPYLVPAAKLFVERLAQQYRAECGQKLVVTSATRPSGNQPRNSHALSVHPAGMAIDFRVSDSASCRSFLESSILALERQGVLNGIREFRPPHYHIALFPEPYLAHVERQRAEEAEREAALARTLSFRAPSALVGSRVASAAEGVAAVREDGEPATITAVSRAATALVLTPLVLLLFWGIPRVW
jgi:hypothetical protein